MYSTKKEPVSRARGMTHSQLFSSPLCVSVLILLLKYWSGGVVRFLFYKKIRLNVLKRNQLAVPGMTHSQLFPSPLCLSVLILYFFILLKKLYSPLFGKSYFFLSFPWYFPFQTFVHSLY